MLGRYLGTGKFDEHLGLEKFFDPVNSIDVRYGLVGCPTANLACIDAGFALAQPA